MTEEVSAATYSGMNINVDLIFHGLNDSIKYKVTIENKGNEEIYINNKGEINNSKFITYDYNWDNNENTIKGNSTKTFEITITYKNQVDDISFKNGSYEEVNNLVIKISDEKGNNLPATNPNTDSNLSIFIILFSVEILIILGAVIYLIKNKKLNIETIKKMKKVNIISMTIFLGLTLLTVIGYSYALETVEIKVNSKIKISRARLARNCSSDSYTIEQTGYCINWNRELSDENVSHIMNYRTKVITEQTKEMPETYEFDEESYELITTKDVSDLQNKEVILGVYEAEDEDLTLLIIGQDGGVLAPVDMSYMFATDKYITPVSLDEEYLEIPKIEIDKNRYLEENIMLNVSYLNLNNLKVDDTNNLSGIFIKNGNNLSYYWYLEGLDKWNTSNVIDIRRMFAEAGAEEDGSTIDSLNNFDTSKVKYMSEAFYDFDGYIENGGISNWNTKNVKDMSYMFSYAFRYSEEFDISNWNTSNVEYMSGMFAGAFNNLKNFDISNWNVSNVKDMTKMFEYSFDKLINFDISNWDVSNVTDMSFMFSGETLSNLQEFDISRWNVSNVKNMCGMFRASYYGETNFSKLKKFDISNWNVSNVTDMSCLFMQAFPNLESFDISKWNVSNVTNMSYMFNQALNKLKKIDISNWYVSKVTNMSEMFYNFRCDEIYLNNFTFTNLSSNSYSSIFYNANYNAKIYVKNEKEKQWILNLRGYYDRPSGWKSENIIVAG